MSFRTLLAFTFAACLVQTAFLGPVIATSPGVNRRAALSLSGMLFCFLPLIAEEFLEVAGLTVTFPHAILGSLTVDYLLAPLFLFYARALTDPPGLERRHQWVHFLPFAAATAAMVPFYASSAAEKLTVLEGGLPSTATLVVWMKLVVGGTYVALTIAQLRRHLRSGNRLAGTTYLHWFYRVMLGLAVTAGAMVTMSVAGLHVPVDSDSVGTLVLCASTYVISYLLIRHPARAPVACLPLDAGSPAPNASRARYQTSPLRTEHKQALLDRVTRHMENDRPWLDMHLTLERLAQAVRTQPAYLSQVLNECLLSNFYEFVNGYRVREVQARIADPDSPERTLLAVAHAAGFASKASFNRVFKRITGMTPTEYSRAHAPARDEWLSPGTTAQAREAQCTP